MADWSLPTLSSTYTNFLAEVKSRDTDLALQFDGTTSTNIPTGAIRWTSASNTWQKWTGSAWGALSSTFAFPAISVTGTAAAQYFSVNATGTAGSVANGIFSPASNTLGLTTNSTSRIHIGSSGDVGIGTTSPGYRLDVQGGNARVFAGGAGTSLEVGVGASGNQYANLDLVGDTTYTDYGLRLIRDNGGANSTASIRHRGTGAFVIAAEEAARITFATSNLDRVTVGADGNVGLGTTTPGTSLDVRFPAASATAGNIRIAPSTAGQARYHLYNGGATAEWLLGQKTSTDHAFKLSKSVAGTEVDYITVDTIGRVGISTITPGYQLDVQGGSARILNQGGSSTIELGQGTTTSQYAFVDLVGDTTYTDYGLRVMRGNSGANTSSFVTHRGTGDLLLQTEDAAAISLRTTNTERFRIGSAGQLGIGGANYGTTGQVLVSQGASALPAWGTPAALSTASGSAPSYSARAWVNFDGTGTVAIRASGNVSSITDNGTGNYTVNFTTALADANYATFVNVFPETAGVAAFGSGSLRGTTTKTTTAITFGTVNYTDSAFTDFQEIDVAIFR